MQLTSLTVRNFRNLASLDGPIPVDGVVVLGDNGHGKTNLLEAIYYLVLFRSFRGAKDGELVRFGERGFFIAGEATDRVTAGYELAGPRKKVTVNGGEASRLSEAVGTITAVTFSPADQAIITGGPAARRRYLDVLLSLSSASYLSCLSAMRIALKQRNAALRRGRAGEATAFDRPYAAAAQQVAAARRSWVKRWSDCYIERCQSMGETGEPRMQYNAHHRPADEDADDLCRALADALDRDLRRGVTTVGPHRDDLTLTLRGADLRTFGSSGQQRTAAIALRLLEAETLTESRGSPPIALYDDVFVELDEHRQAHLLALIRQTLPGQAIITAPRESEVPAELLDRPRWRMRGGSLER